MVLIPVVLVETKQNNKKLLLQEKKLWALPDKTTFIAGVLCGVAVTIASNFISKLNL